MARSDSEDNRKFEWRDAQEDFLPDIRMSFCNVVRRVGFFYENLKAKCVIAVENVLWHTCSCMRLFVLEKTLEGDFMTLKSKFLSYAAFTCALLVGQMAQAIQFVGSSGSLAASVTFSAAGGVLTVTLANTSAADVLVPADVLTAVFFDLAGPSLTSASALLGPGSTVVYDPDGQPVGGVVGGEWAYGAGLSGAPGGAARGISSAGFGLFGAATFPGPELNGNAASVNGVGYGILSAGDNIATGNNGVVGNPGVIDSAGLIKNSVVFTLTYSGVLNEADIRNVSFQYGTALGGGPQGQGEPPT